MSTKDNLINVGLLAAGGVAIAAASGVYGEGSAAKVDKSPARWFAKKYGVSQVELSAYDGKLLDSVDLTVEAWRERIGFPAPNSPLSRGYFLDLLRERTGKGSRARDGSYEATLMFDADEDDPTVRAQRQLQANPYVPQARPLTAEPPRITSAQGSAARGVTDSYVEDYLNGENIAISTFLARRLRGKAKQYANQYARRMTAALEALVASGEVYRDTTPKGAASYRRTEAQGSVARGSSSVLRGMTSKAGTPIPGPSLKTLDDRLNLGGEEGKSLKYFMQAGQRQAALDYANELLGGNGIEYIESQQDTMRHREGLSYVNMGDTYDTTLIYDHATGRFYVGAWGDWVERYPKRFGFG